jgi:hypothetical protein
MKKLQCVFMEVLLTTQYGNLWGQNYDANKPDAYGNSNAPVVTEGVDGPYCNIFFKVY